MSHHHWHKGWRLIAALAPRGLYFSDHFHGAVATDPSVSLEEIAAVLNSPIANAWFDANCRSRKVILAILKDLPFPRFDTGVRDDVRAVVRELEKAVLDRWSRARGTLFDDVLTDAVDITDLQARLDRLVHEAYRLSPEEHRDIVKMMSAERRPG